MPLTPWRLCASLADKPNTTKKAPEPKFRGLIWLSRLKRIEVMRYGGRELAVERRLPPRLRQAFAFERDSRKPRLRMSRNSGEKSSYFD